MRRAVAAVRELLVLLAVAAVLAFLLRTFVVQIFYIPSSSMEPTLAVDDRIMVEKLTYRLRPPRAGEIVVFADDAAQARSEGAPFLRAVGQFLGVVPMDARDLVKRVIGVGGDVVTIGAGVVSVNGEPIDEPYVLNANPGSYGPYEVPAGELFVLGDNRPGSADSRFPSLGFVDADDVVGRMVATIWPLDSLGGGEAASYDG